MSGDVQSSPDDEYARFEELARTVVNTPKPVLDPSVEAGGEPAEGGAEREDT